MFISKTLNFAKKSLFIGLVVLFAACSKKEWKVGDKVHVKSKGFWYEATILSVEKDNSYRIHYTGWDDTYDEVVVSERVRSTSDGNAMPAPSGAFKNLNLHTIGKDTTAQGETTTLDKLPDFDEKLTYAIGDTAWVEWGGKWYKSSVLGVLKDNKYKIHYEGWTSASDEEVSNNRMRPKE